uniref:Uncharacterized protein n=2 Tax=Meloidogyne TaxID=189290 RepID=A0A914MXZ5_MELIC
MENNNHNNTEKEGNEDIDQCLPSPLRQENEVSEESSMEEDGKSEREEGEEEEGNEEINNLNKIPLNEKAYLTHEEAVINVLEKGIAPNDFLKSWSNEDLMGVIIQLTKHNIDDEGVKQIAKHFKDTTHEEIVDCINQCKSINKLAEQGRYRLEEMSKPEVELINNNQNPKIYSNWLSLVDKMKKFKSVGDCSGDVISTFLTECSDEAGTSLPGAPNYKRIYFCLSQLVKGYSMKNARMLDEAVILDIFENIEKEIDSRPDITRFLRKVFRDAQYLTEQDFRLDEMNENNLEKLFNIFNFPFDKIKFVP